MKPEQYYCRILEVNKLEVTYEMMITKAHIKTITLPLSLFEKLGKLKQGDIFLIETDWNTHRIIPYTDNIIKSEDFDLKMPETILKDIDLTKFNKY